MDELKNFLNSDTLKELVYLFERWQDESMYEDWKDYESEMKERLKAYLPEAKFIKGTENPFGLKYSYKGSLYHTRIIFTGSSVVLDTKRK